MKSYYDYIKIFQAIISQYATKENIMALKTINKLLFLLKEKLLPCLELKEVAENQPVISH